MAGKKPEKPALPLPGERPVDQEVARMIRVDHAGEFGAARIYDGQLAVLGKNHPVYPKIKAMKDQEKEHLDTFDKMVPGRAVRPTALNPLWHGAGYALGAVTALMGEKAAMACTAAVEEVIEDHYQSQIDKLDHWQAEKDLNKTIKKFQADEIHHKDTAIEHGAEKATGYKVLSATIKAGCRTAIWLSKRI